MNPHIVILEDDKQMQFLLTRLLEREGYRVSSADDGEKGVKLIDEIKPDLIITDILMPEKDGLATILDVRKKYPDVKIIAISGGGRLDAQGYLNLASRFGVNDIFSKPFQTEAFLERVQGLLQT